MLYEAAVRRKKPLLERSERNRWLAVLFGIAPDLVSFGPMFLARFIFNFRSSWMMKPNISQIPAYVFGAYNWTHSLVIFGLVFGLIWLIRRKIFYPILGWLLHILIDIPSHSIKFFPTPFLWPIFGFRINGLSWADPWFMVINYAALIAVYLILYLPWPRKAKRQGVQIVA